MDEQGLFEVTVKSVVPEQGIARVVDERGEELELYVDDETSIEVVEHETVGHIEGELGDIGEGYLAEVIVEDRDGKKVCRLLRCLS
ncbi:MAG: hypothetical protein ACE5JJ_04035 [Nitrospinota bacterium]